MSPFFVNNQDVIARFNSKKVFFVFANSFYMLDEKGFHIVIANY